MQSTQRRHVTVRSASKKQLVDYLVAAYGYGEHDFDDYSLYKLRNEVELFDSPSAFEKFAN